MGFFRSAARTFGALAESARRYARGERATPFDVPPPAITVAFVGGLAVPGALVEIEAVAAVPG